MIVIDAFSKNPKPRLAQRHNLGKFGAASPGRSILKVVEDGASMTDDINQKIIQPAHFANIYMAGDIAAAKQICATYCFDIKLCVTVTATEFIYKGGRETGFIVGLMNYPRFPSTPVAIDIRAHDVAMTLIRALAQDSALIQTPEHTIWLSRR